MKKSIKILTAVLAVIMLAAFTDVPKTYWGYEEINNASKLGIIDGYPDGSFGPTKSISKNEVATMFYRVMKISGLLKETSDLSVEMASSFESIKVDEWARPYVSYGFKYGLWDIADFKSQTSSGADSASRQMMAQWLTKAAGYELSPCWVLFYEDYDNFDSKYIPYADALLRHAIMEGDDLKKFNPKNDIIRAEVAAICVRVVNDLKTSSKGLLKSDITTKYGKVEKVNTSDKSLVLSTSNGTEHIKFDSSAVILFNGNVSSFDQAITKGQYVTVSCVAGTNTVIVQTKMTDIKANITSIQNKGDYTLYSVKINGSDAYFYSTITHNVNVGSDVLIHSDGCEILEIR